MVRRDAIPPATVRGRVHSRSDSDLLTLPRVLISRTTTCIHLALKCFSRYEDRRGPGLSGA